MSENVKERAILFFLIALLVIAIAGLVNALIQEDLRNKTLEGYVLRIEHAPCKTPDSVI